MQAEYGTILCNERIAKDTYRMEIQARMASEMLPGQFVNIKVDGYLLRRPISICSIVDATHFVIVYKVVGEGTYQLSTMHPHRHIDLFGPLGSSFPIHADWQEVLLVGGGAGVPPLYEVAKRYRQLDKNVHVVLGFQSADQIFYEDAFAAMGAHVIISTMDGTKGIKGTVMDAIQQAQITCQTMYSCGPQTMLKALQSVYTKGYMSFESRMACGIGACMACVCKDKEDKKLYYRICKEGPVFPIGKVEI